MVPECVVTITSLRHYIKIIKKGEDKCQIKLIHKMHTTKHNTFSRCAPNLTIYLEADERIKFVVISKEYLMKSQMLFNQYERKIDVTNINSEITDGVC